MSRSSHTISAAARTLDALLRYPDGPEAALELSSLGPEAEAAITRVLRKTRHQRVVEGLRQTWMVTVPRDFPPAELGKLDGVLLLCEERGNTSLDWLGFSSVPN